MARYYEETALIEFVKKYTPHINGETTMECVERAIRNAPTADVVPKSEVESEIKVWQELYADTVSKWEEAYEELEIKLENTKAEVAREIFAEIEKKIKALLTLHLEELNKEYIQDTPLYDRHSGILFALQCMEDFIAELKKKYSEGERK